MFPPHRRPKACYSDPLSKSNAAYTLDDLYPHSQGQDYPSGLSALLRDLDVGAVALEGDVSDLFQEFSKLAFEEICRLRESACFVEYRRLYGELEDKDQPKDKTFLASIAKQALACGLEAESRSERPAVLPR